MFSLAVILQFMFNKTQSHTCEKVRLGKKNRFTIILEPFTPENLEKKIKKGKIAEGTISHKLYELVANSVNQNLTANVVVFIWGLPP